MATIPQESMDVQRNDCLTSTEKSECIPRQLIEANELLNSINRRLEDCALEWQAKISRKQWEIFNSKANGENPPEQSILTRTYFIEKDRDEAFRHLLSCNKIFSEYLRNFIGLLRGEQPILGKETCDAQNQWSDPSKKYKSNDYLVESLCLSPLENQRSNESRSQKDLINNLTSVQNSFADVIKAKVNFDTKFLGFEAVLHKTTSETANATYSCQYCSNVEEDMNGNQKRLRNETTTQRNKIPRRRRRVTRSTRTLSNRRGRKSPIAIGDVGDAIVESTSYENFAL